MKSPHAWSFKGTESVCTKCGMSWSFWTWSMSNTVNPQIYTCGGFPSIELSVWNMIKGVVDALPPEIRTILRKRAGLRTGDNVPIVLVRGNKKPAFRGEGGCYTTPSGRTIVRHPVAYRHAKGRCAYRPSTRRVEVGWRWLELWLSRSPTYSALAQVVRIHAHTYREQLGDVPLYMRWGREFRDSWPKRRGHI